MPHLTFEASISYVEEEARKLRAESALYVGARLLGAAPSPGRVGGKGRRGGGVGVAREPSAVLHAVSIAETDLIDGPAIWCFSLFLFNLGSLPFKGISILLGMHVDELEACMF